MPSGEPAPIPPYPDFSTHRWEIGAGYGVYNRENLVTAYADYGITDSIDIEAVVQQAFGTLDNRIIATIGLRHTFVPEWKWFSPTAGIGTGYQRISDKVPPAPLESSNQMAYVSLGARGFITRRFMWRADWRHYVVFNNLNVYEDTGRMEIRLSSILLAAALLSGCSWFHRGDKKPAPVRDGRGAAARALHHRAAGDAPRRKDPEDQGEGLRGRARTSAPSASRTSAPTRSTACAPPTT